MDKKRLILVFFCVHSVSTLKFDFFAKNWDDDFVLREYLYQTISAGSWHYTHCIPLIPQRRYGENNHIINSYTL